MCGLRMCLGTDGWEWQARSGRVGGGVQADSVGIVILYLLLSWILLLIVHLRGARAARMLDNSEAAAFRPVRSTKEARLHLPFDVTAVAAIHLADPTFQVASRLLSSPYPRL